MGTEEEGAAAEGAPALGDIGRYGEIYGDTGRYREAEGAPAMAMVRVRVNLT